MRGTALPGLKTAGGAVTSVAVTIALLGCLLLLREDVQRAEFAPVGRKRLLVRSVSVS